MACVFVKHKKPLLTPTRLVETFLLGITNNCPQKRVFTKTNEENVLGKIDISKGPIPADDQTTLA